MLLDSIRKLWVDLLARKITATLHSENFLSPNQSGFLRNKSTTTSTLQLITALEETAENSSSIFGSSWDFKKAFDSVIADIKRMALRRARFPQKDVDFLQLLDDDAPTIVRTPFALSIWKKSKYAGFLHYYRAFRTHGSFFFPRAGVGQGDVPSPHIWNLVMDILLRHLSTIVSTTQEYRSVPRTAFIQSLTLSTLMTSSVLVSPTSGFNPLPT
jgi:hypothetical protein